MHIQLFCTKIKVLTKHTHPIEDHDEDQVDDGSRGGGGDLGVTSHDLLGRRVEERDDDDAIHDDGEHRGDHTADLKRDRQETRVRNSVANVPKFPCLLPFSRTLFQVFENVLQEVRTSRNNFRTKPSIGSVLITSPNSP